MRRGVPSRSRISAASPRPLRGVRRDPDVERLALAHGGVERAHRLLERRLRIEAVRVEDVDVVEAQAAEALVEAGEQVLARSPFSVRPRPHVVTGLRRDHELVAVRREVGGEQPPERLLGRPVRRPVVVREVEVRDPPVECATRDRAARPRAGGRRRRWSTARARSRAAAARCGPSVGRASSRSGRATGRRSRTPPFGRVGELFERPGASGSASESRLRAASVGSPERIRLTGTSSTLPDSVRGTAGTARTSSGTCRGEQSSRIRVRIRATRSSSSTASRGARRKRHVPPAFPRAAGRPRARRRRRRAPALRCRSRPCPSGSRRG